MLMAHSLFPYFLEKLLAIPTSPFSFTSVNGSSVTSFRTFLETPYLLYSGGQYRCAGMN